MKTHVSWNRVKYNSCFWIIMGWFWIRLSFDFSAFFIPGVCYLIIFHPRGLLLFSASLQTISKIKSTTSSSKKQLAIWLIVCFWYLALLLLIVSFGHHYYFIITPSRTHSILLFLLDVLLLFGAHEKSHSSLDTPDKNSWSHRHLRLRPILVMSSAWWLE